MLRQAEAAHLGPIRLQRFEVTIVQLGVAADLLLTVQAEGPEQIEELCDLVDRLPAQLRDEVAVLDRGAFRHGILERGLGFVQHFAGANIAYRLAIVRKGVRSGFEGPCRRTRRHWRTR